MRKRVYSWNEKKTSSWQNSNLTVMKITPQCSYSDMIPAVRLLLDKDQGGSVTVRVSAQPSRSRCYHFIYIDRGVYQHTHTFYFLVECFSQVSSNAAVVNSEYGKMWAGEIHPVAAPVATAVAFSFFAPQLLEQFPVGLLSFTEIISLLFRLTLPHLSVLVLLQVASLFYDLKQNHWSRFHLW